jgi:hypothetical protein
MAPFQAQALNKDHNPIKSGKTLAGPDRPKAPNLEIQFVYHHFAQVLTGIGTLVQKLTRPSRCLVIMSWAPLRPETPCLQVSVALASEQERA